MTSPGADAEKVTGQVLHDLCGRLYPICRSITGNGVRETLRILAQQIDLQISEIPTGTQVFDWAVPQEWNFRQAYLETLDGRRVVDSASSNLHVLNYSTAVDRVVESAELQKHLFSLPEQPAAIPYRTSYYAPNWGLCLSQQQRDALTDDAYRVVIDTSLTDGSLTFGECFIPGASEEEILISTHICHPSLANDNLSGISVATHLARYFAQCGPLRYGLRFVFVPSTIGAVTWLATNEKHLGRIIAGLVISGVGDGGAFTYKRSRNGEGLVDRILSRLLEGSAFTGTVRPYLPYGYDERQYCSPGIDIAAGCLMRTPYGEYPEYHTSGDNLNFIHADSLLETFELCATAIRQIQCAARYRNLSPKGEPQLGKRGLYENIGGDNESKTRQLALLWMLSYSDGEHSTLDISDMSGIDLEVLDVAAGRLCSAGLLEEFSLRGKHEPS